MPFTTRDLCEDREMENALLFAEEKDVDALLAPLIHDLNTRYAHNVHHLLCVIDDVQRNGHSLETRLVAKRFLLVALLTMPVSQRPADVLPPFGDRDRAFLNLIAPKTEQLGKNNDDPAAFVQHCIRVFQIT